MEPVPMEAFPCGDWDPLSVLLTNEDLALTQRVVENQMYDMMSLVIPEAYFSASPVDYPANQTVPGIWEGFLDPTVPADGSSRMVSSQESSCASGLSSGFCGYYSEMPASVEDQADNEASIPSVKRVQPKRKCSNSNLWAREAEGTGTDAPPNQKKRKPRGSNDKGKKNVKPKKKQKLVKPNGDEEEEEGNIMATLAVQGLSTCSSEEDSVSQELNNGESAQNSDGNSALNSDGKTTRASRGTATDPQSLYARRRRERINERLRILQNLIPNGTKVDLSTMLEEAVHYVKFLQLQIKLLSSDELWMYAPIAYNGMDIGLNQNLPPHLS